MSQFYGSIFLFFPLLRKYHTIFWSVESLIYFLSPLIYLFWIFFVTVTRKKMWLFVVWAFICSILFSNFLMFQHELGLHDFLWIYFIDIKYLFFRELLNGPLNCLYFWMLWIVPLWMLIHRICLNMFFINSLKYISKCEIAGYIVILYLN